MKYLILLPLILTGCLSPAAKQLPLVIRELAKDTNAVSLRITSPAFGTPSERGGFASIGVKFQRSQPSLLERVDDEVSQQRDRPRNSEELLSVRD